MEDVKIDERDTYTIYDDQSIGKVQIADEVVAIIAGLAAQGTSEISNVKHIERGYEDIIGKLSGIGADIRAVEVPDPEQKAAPAAG